MDKNKKPIKLLIITQKVDRSDDVLGFFHAWIEKFAARCSSVVVICLQEGEHDLPQNVSVLSLGKEQVRSRGRYIKNFYQYIFKKREDYDTVFIHMNPVYAVLGGLLWKLWGKPFFLWFNHPRGTLLARLAIAVSGRVMCTSPFAFAARFAKTNVMPAGIDTQVFSRSDTAERRKNSILYLGRISPVKQIEHLLAAAGILDAKGVDFKLHVIGSPMTDSDRPYEQQLHDSALELLGKGKVMFSPRVENSETPVIYNTHDVFVNLTPTGSFDKTVLEAMACETPVLVSNKSFEHAVPSQCLFRESDPQDLADKLEQFFTLSREEKQQYGQKLRDYVVQEQTLDKLIEKILN